METAHEQGEHELPVAHQIWMLIMKLYNENSKSFTTDLKQVGLNPTQFEVLYFVREHESMDQKTIAKHLNLTQGNITQCIYKLEGLGLIEHRKDWKTKHISLTQAGRALMCRLIPQQQAQMEVALSGLSTDEQKILRELLARFANTCHREQQKRGE